MDPAFLAMLGVETVIDLIRAWKRSGLGNPPTWKSGRFA